MQFRAELRDYPNFTVQGTVNTKLDWSDTYEGTTGKPKRVTIRPGSYKIGDTDYRCSYINFNISEETYNRLRKEIQVKSDGYWSECGVTVNELFMEQIFHVILFWKKQHNGLR